MIYEKDNVYYLRKGNEYEIATISIKYNRTRKKNVIVLKNGKNIYPEEFIGTWQLMGEITEPPYLFNPKETHYMPDTILTTLELYKDGTTNFEHITWKERYLIIKENNIIYYSYLILPEEYENEILKLKSQGHTLRAIGEKYGFTYEQVHNFISRYNMKQRKVEAGMALKRKGRPPKNYVVSEQDKVAELKYILARKEAKIKSLEMENELMRDFLSLTERK